MTPPYDVVIIGAGQTGLATAWVCSGGHHPVLLNSRVGDAWRQRWDFVTLLTPAGAARCPALLGWGRGDAAMIADRIGAAPARKSEARPG